MHSQHKHKFSLFILPIFYLGTTLGTTIYSGAAPPLFHCGNDPFDCGNLRHIAYPFWGGNRNSRCGRKGFEIICDDNVPTLNISSLSYRVEELDFSTNTLTVSRRDSLDSMCPSTNRNTAIDMELFKYPPDSTVCNVTLYFDCSGDHINGNASSSPGLGTGIRCKSNIDVPINSKQAESLQNHPSEYSLKSAFDSGFSIRWSYYSKQSTLPFCNSEIYASCSVPYRYCELIPTCTFTGDDDIVDALVPSPAYGPESHPPEYGLAPVPTPSAGGNVLGSPNAYDPTCYICSGDTLCGWYDFSIHFNTLLTHKTTTFISNWPSTRTQT
ncbi:hypothetical protein C2S52_008036 [Perilla frutescens var. hirtella]|nr:hypothetical protein C2S52_008036 [Perilla frutescens var. hirtella]